MVDTSEAHLNYRRNSHIHGDAATFPLTPDPSAISLQCYTYITISYIDGIQGHMLSLEM